ncbi:Uncharacterised protein [uncultured archaeon]|nr:Uncharacterised protein [uncultured archaeon]
MENKSGNSKKTGRTGKFLAMLFIIALAIAAVFAMESSPTLPTGNLVGNQTVSVDENMLFVYEISRYPTQVEISNATGKNISLGFSLEPWNLNFGIVPTGGNLGKRFVSLQNVAERPAKIQLNAYGNISPMIVFSDNNFLLSREGIKPVEIVLATQKDTQLGNYSGEIDVIVKKPKYDFVQRLL